MPAPLCARGPTDAPRCEAVNGITPMHKQRWVPRVLGGPTDARQLTASHRCTSSVGYHECWVHHRQARGELSAGASASDGGRRDPQPASHPADPQSGSLAPALSPASATPNTTVVGAPVLRRRRGRLRSAAVGSIKLPPPLDGSRAAGMSSGVRACIGIQTLRTLCNKRTSSMRRRRPPPAAMYLPTPSPSSSASNAAVAASRQWPDCSA